MAEPGGDFDPDIADLLQRGLGSNQPVVDAAEVVRQAITAGRHGNLGWPRAGLAAVAAILIVAAAFLLSGGAPLGDGASQTLHLSGYSVRYPTDWEFQRVDHSPSFYTILGYLASGPLDGSFCTSTSCGPDHLDLASGDAVLVITERHAPGATKPSAEPGESALRVASMPAFYSEVRPVREGGRTLLTWRILMPESVGALLILEAHLQGPDVAAREAEVRSIVDSLAWDNPPRDLPKDPAAVAQAVRRALASVDADWNDPCFPAPGETVEATVDQVPSYGLQLRSVLPVTCSTRLEETDERLWKVTLVMAWNVPEYSGSVTIQHWVTADGEVVSSEARSDGRVPPMIGDGSTPYASPSPPVDAGRASWALPTDPEIGPSTTQFTALVTERACASGRSAEGRVIGPVIEYTANAVIVTFQVQGLDGAQACPSNPSTPVQVTLDEPLGDRQLLDGDSKPPREPPRCEAGGYCE